MKQNYKSDIELGKMYRDTQTGIEGIATAIYFFQHACERVQIEYVNQKDGELKELVFDAPRLVDWHGKRATTDRPGGPARSGEGRRPGP
jgi:hypothetical protein